ncbi:hypothetical protein N0V90_004205 [Kalmusia sp. IMI 367209]|nr:hypothetical protein N0V90_004205 [Kalmusia sp. IMI 367209]
MASTALFTATLLAATALAQVPGPLTPEVHPSLTSYTCTKSGGCQALNTSVVLDSAYRWLHNVDGYSNCITSGFNETFCPDVETCAKTCSLEGVDYASYGIRTSGDALTMNIYKTDPATNVTTLSSPRVYLLKDDETYDHFSLLNKEFSFDVDVSNVPCGINGALYFSEMNQKGDQNELNKAGAKYGTGYCDAQCPTVNFIKGEVRSAATVMRVTKVFVTKMAATSTPIATETKPTTALEGNYTVDTGKPFTVVTQFITSDGSANGTLKEIRRLYVQAGKVIQNAKVNVPGLDPADSISDEYCTKQKQVFGGQDDTARQGGLKQMGEAIRRGMVLAFAIWDDAGSYMGWLDQDPYPADADSSKPGVGRGPCPTTGGRPADLIKQYPNARVVFSNIKSGEIGSTYSNSTVHSVGTVRH